jgi:hypothetical protein
MLKIVNQTSYEIQYNVALRRPTSQHLAKGALAPGHIAAYRIDNEPANNQDALNCTVETHRKVDNQTVFLERINVPGNATVVYSTQIVTGPLHPPPGS